MSANATALTSIPLAIHTNDNGFAADLPANGKRKGADDGPAHAQSRVGCAHVQPTGGGDRSGLPIQIQIRAALRRARQSTEQVRILLEEHAATSPLRSERVHCLSCDFSGVREDLDDATQCFMTHALLQNHHFALLPRKKKLFCARCIDFVYPDELLTLTQLVTPSQRHRTPDSNHSSHSHRHHHNHHHQFLPQHHRHHRRAPALRRRLMRSSARRGLVNMGNTCYMNAVLQALVHNPLLQHEYFVVRGHNTTICEQRRRHNAVASPQNEPQSSATLAPCMGCEMSSLMQTLFPAPRATLTARHLTSPVVPQSFMETFWSACPSFVGSQQHDAHEFLVSLLNGIHSSTCTRTAASSASSNVKQDSSLQSPRFSPSGRSLCDCVVHQNMAGVFNSEIACVLCNTVSSKFDPFLDITLSLETATSTPRRSNSSVDDAFDAESSSLSLASLLRRFTQEERLKNQEQVYCRRCSRYVDAIKRLVLHKLPNLLVFHLGRFDFAKKRKIMGAVAFPLQGLDLAEFCSTVEAPPEVATPTPSRGRKEALVSEVSSSSGRSSPLTPPPPAAPTRDAVYDLAAVISHHGDSVEGGHFTAFVHSSQDASADESPWLHFDDSSVERVTAERVQEAQAYMLLYLRRRLFV